MSKRTIRLVLVGVTVLLCSFGLSGVLSYVALPKTSSPATAPTETGSTSLSPVASEADRAMTAGAQQMDDMIRELRARLDECGRRERELARRQRRLDMAAESLKTEAQDLENLRLQLVGPLTRLNEARAALEQTRVRIAADEQANLKRTAGVYEKMDSVASSRILTEMCQNSRDTDAARILHFMSERSAAKCLAEMSDRALAARLTGHLKRIKEES